MPIKIMTSSGLRTIQRLRVMHFGQLRTVRSLKVMDNGNIRLVGNFYPDVAVSISPTSAYGTSTGGLATTNSVTASASGGLYPYTYAWVRLSNDNPGTPVAVSPTLATTSFRGLPDGSATFQVTVTDSLGSQATATVIASFADIT